MHDPQHLQPPPPPPPLPPIPSASWTSYAASPASRSTPYIRQHRHQQSFASTTYSTSSLQLPSASVPSFQSYHGGSSSATSPPAIEEGGDMAEQRRHQWRRGTSSSTQQHLQQPQTPKLYREHSDGYVPYRPPFIASSSAPSLSPPVRPSGAQGIGLAPAPAPPTSTQPAPKRSLFGTLFGPRRKRKQQQQQTLANAAGVASTKTPASGYHYDRNQGRSRDQRQAHDDGYHSHGHFGQYIPREKRPNADPQAVKPSPSVLTGLLAPKMLFSPLSRNLRSDNHPSDPLHAPGRSSHPYGSTPDLQRTGHDRIEVVHVEPHSRYPRIGENASFQSLPGQKSRWASSNITLSSEGSKSRLAVSSVCDALTFPRPRMNAHNITPPDSPDAMESEVEDPAPGQYDSDVTDFTRALSERDAREAEREEWAEFARSRRSNSFGRRSSEWSAHGTPVRSSSSRHTLTAGERPPPIRSRSTSSSIRSLFRSGTQRFGRVSQSHDNLPQTLTHLDGTPKPVRQQRSDSTSQHSHQSSWNSSQRSAVPQRSNSRKNLSNVFRRNNSLPKSTSTPTLAERESRLNARQNKSVRTHRYSRSNPDVSGITMPPSSPPIKRRPTGPPRTFQFRLQPASTRGGPSKQPANAGVMVVGSSSGDARLPKLPRAIDFAEPSRLRPPTPPSPPPHLHTPEGVSPFNYPFDDSTIGVAITTDSSEVAPTVEAVPQKLPLHTPPSARPSHIREDPSSAHARYVLARQHRRERTMRAFQAPPMSPSSRNEKSPTIYPQSLPGQDRPSIHSRASIYSQQLSYSRPPSIAAAMSPAAYPRPEYPTPQRQLSHKKRDRDSARRSSTPPPPVPKLSHSAPASPKSPTTPWFGRPRATVPLSPKGGSRAKPATPTRAKVVRPPVPALPLDVQASIQTPSRQKERSVPESPTPMRREKALPLLPGSAPARIPPQRAPPSFPPPPTPPYPPSRSGSSNALDEAGRASRSSSSRGHSRGASEVSLPLSPIATTTPRPSRALTGSPTPRRKDSLGAASGPGPTAPAAPFKNPRQTPPPSAMPTIMDESPTPIRQTRVSVLAAEKGSPSTPVPAGAASGDQLASSTSSASSSTGERSLQSSFSGTPSLLSRRAGAPSTLFPLQAPSPGTSSFTTAMPPRSHTSGRRTRRSILSGSPIFGAPGSGAAGGSAGTGASSSAPIVTRTVGRHTPEVTAPLRHMASATALTSVMGSDRESTTSHSSSVSLYSAEMSSDAWQTPTVYPSDLNPMSDSDSELSEATLPDLFSGPISSSSALSHYSDALESPVGWVVPEEEEPPMGTPSAAPRQLAVPEDSAVTPPQTRVSPALDPVVEGPATPPTQIRRASDDNRLTITAEQQATATRHSVLTATPGDRVESLTVTPTPRQHHQRSPSDETSHSPKDDAFEYDRASVSSGSESSVHQSLDESFRGLFFRTPQGADAGQGAERQRSGPLPQSSLRYSPVRGEYGGAIQSSPRTLHTSPHDFGEAGSERTFELRTPLLGGSGGGSATHSTSGSGSQPFPRGPMDSATGTLAPPSPAIAQGLGMSLMSPNSPGASFPPIFESRLGTSTPPVSPMPRDDSWISESYRQAAAALRAGSSGSIASHHIPSGGGGSTGATSTRKRSKNKHRSFSAENALSPSTFGVSSDATLPDPLQLPTAEDQPIISGTATATAQRQHQHSTAAAYAPLPGLVASASEHSVVERSSSPAA